ncbi:Polycomb-group transcriptional regulator [Handroanthus impetiginosus]|uniref:Polycomb-group transcriptional regulator n=1 Tax=Handroanthus impetiginosus TaxID=429701 RepID=A0A2G9H0X9_9LAMI|nr:Polycomb-group transcriptional regulator [Handroanthus impetiginosus]
MVSQVPLDCELCLDPASLGSKDGDASVPSSSQEQAAPQMPVKKQTRQWAAWTRQEEESFFAALRQVGKNFEKITCRVQSKNKDQVRHYYYRLVRRMNKLLGPELCLDAKNSKDTNAAMLRWWSLLEKYSCKASKLHLKPRRFKIFVETLENQLLKDRKKNIKKRVSSGENNSSIPNISAANHVRASGHDNRAVKMVLVDSQNIQKVGSGKGALFKRNVNIGPNGKVDPASVKTAKHRRKGGLASAAAYRRWEKAAIAGVSLVADAAEHLERVDTDKEIEHVQETPGHDGSQLVGKEVHSLQTSSPSMLNENIVQNSTKLKLQLFPIDECTRKALEMDHHNPHLELTLSTRKKISSVIEHLNRKWGNSSLLSQELMLFPYWAQRENLVGYQKWTKDSPLCAADVYYLIGRPSIFRLRVFYSNLDTDEFNAETTENTSIPCNDQLVSAKQIIAPRPLSTSNPMKAVDCGVSVSDINISRYHDSLAVVSSFGEENGDLAVTRQVESTKDVALSAAEWADTLTNISVGDLLSESTENMDINCTEFPVPLGSNSPQQIPFSCDSFDAAIAAHIYKQQNKIDSQQGLVSHVPSIWDAEETCDAFAFQKPNAFCNKDQNASMNDSLDAFKQAIMTSPSASHKEVEELPEMEKLTNSNCTYGDVVDDCRPDHPSENPTKDFSGLSDIYWPDSLGALDLDIPSCRYHNNDLILSDSLGGLNRLIANSLDAFQNCSFLGLDKKEPASTAEAHQTASLSDFKIGS